MAGESFSVSCHCLGTTECIHPHNKVNTVILLNNLHPWLKLPEPPWVCTHGSPSRISIALKHCVEMWICTIQWWVYLLAHQWRTLLGGGIIFWKLGHGRMPSPLLSLSLFFLFLHSCNRSTGRQLPCVILVGCAYCLRANPEPWSLLTVNWNPWNCVLMNWGS